ncbi:MAG: hypothetical protein U0835_11435 [Isosphaeraceae bacterium]
MNTIGVLLLAAATAGDSFGYDKPGVGLKKLLRPHVVTHGAPPPGGMIQASMGAPDAGPPNGGRRFPNVKSQVYFLDPDGMHIGWQTGGNGGERVYLPAQLTVPARYNFMQGYIYRLKLTEIPGRPNVSLYPTIEVAPSTPATDAYLTHNPIPIQFTAEDFDQVVDGGNFVTKVIYLPDPKYQELAIAGVETLVSTRLEPGVDPILEADKRGTILLIVRLGAIDLEMQGSMGAVGAAVAPPTVDASAPTTLMPAGIAAPGCGRRPGDRSPGDGPRPGRGPGPARRGRPGPSGPGPDDPGPPGPRGAEVLSRPR